MPVSPKERVKILAFLTMDEDAEIRNLALTTLKRCTVRELHPILTNPATPASFLELAAFRLVKEREDLLEPLLTNQALPERLQDQILSELAALGGPSVELTEEGVLATELKEEPARNDVRP